MLPIEIHLPGCVNKDVRTLAQGKAYEWSLVVVDACPIQATNVEHQVRRLVLDKRAQQFIDQTALGTVRDDNVVIVTALEGPNGLLDVELDFFL